MAIDVNRATCDPSLYYKEGSAEYMSAKHLDDTAGRIADFVEDGRDYAHRVIWTAQHVCNIPGEEQDNTYQEVMPHRVRPFPMDDEYLIKTRMSAYPEHQEVFDRLKAEGVDTIIVCGFYADKCVRETVRDLLKQGFHVLVPVDLTAEPERTHPMRAFIEEDVPRAERLSNYVASEQLVFTDAEHTLWMLEQPENKRQDPRHVADVDGDMWTLSP